MTVAALTVNGRINPLGIADEDISFGWMSESSARGVNQSAYEIRVESQTGADDIWMSGKVASSQQTDVRYDGPALTSQTRYSWRVRVWDDADNASDWSQSAWFETGILDPAEWTADWIGQGSALDNWTNYTAEFDFTIVDYAFGAFVRAPTTTNALMWQLSVADGTPRLRPHRKTNNSYSLLANIDLSSVVTVTQLTSQVNKLEITVSPGTDATSTTVVTRLNGTQVDSRVVTGTGASQRGYVGFRADNANGPAERFTVSEVKVTASGGATLLETDFSDGNPFNGGTVTDGALVVNGPQREFLWNVSHPLPLLRKAFTTTPGKTILTARMYASAQGIYELRLNGAKVGDQELAPGWTDYRSLFQHQTYDVTSLVQAGNNAVGGLLGDGWWAGRLAHIDRNQYGDSVGLIAQLRIDYTDGTHQVIGTDDSWRLTTGPYIAADLIDGEHYDARAEKPGWDEPEYDDSTWVSPNILPADTKDLIVPQPDEPVRVTEELAVLERTEPTAGSHLYDLGQNMVGVVRVRLQGTAGQTVQLRFAEVLNPDGTMYTANLRSAKATDTYTFATTGTVTYQPKFTQHGFRYLEITGVTTPPAPADVVGVVLGSDLVTTGSFETSDARINQLQSNIVWGQRGNFLSIPTDTPARDERLGWTGDINVFAPTAAFNQDTRIFLSKWLKDLRVAQLPNGDVPSVAPTFPGPLQFSGSTGWSDAMITVPYSLYQAYGDLRVVRENYTAMKEYFTYQASLDDGALIKTRGGYLDWLHLSDPTPATVLSTAYYAENARMLSEMAAAIGDEPYSAQLASLSADIRDAFSEELVTADGTVAGNSQAGYAMALGMDLVPQERREQLAAKFTAKLASSDNHLTTGFLGTPWLLPGLSGAGRTDNAFQLLMNDQMPSWLYEVEQGATTMWERWDSLRPDGSFGDVVMNSFNHYAFGAVGDWMYQNIGGLQIIEPGYKKSRIAPLPGGGITDARASLQTVYGELASAWEYNADGFALDVKVPVNTTSEIHIPAGHVLQVTESGVPLDQVEGVLDMRVADGEVVLTVGSGSYSFQVHSSLTELIAAADAVTVVMDRVAEHTADGDIPSATETELTNRLETISDAIVDAISAHLDDNQVMVSQRLTAALTTAIEARSWLGDEDLTVPVATDLDNGLASLQTVLGGTVAWSYGVTIALAPGGDVVPRQQITGQFNVANTGDHAITDIAATVTVADWTVSSAQPIPGDLAPGESTPVAFTATVPANASPAPVEATLSAQFTVDGQQIALTVTDTWVIVDSTVTITAVQGSHAAGDQRAQVAVTVRNDAETPVSGQIVLQTPEKWLTPPPSVPIGVPAQGGTANVTIAVPIPDQVVANRYDIQAVFQRDTVTYATGSGSLEIQLDPPATGIALDHVDFGESVSETAHQVTASPSSGTSNEAGYSRRYSHSNFPGSWFSAVVDVEPGEPFIGVIRETFDGARTKKYNVYVDDVLQTQVFVPRTQSGSGILMHQFVITDPDALDHDGSVKVTFEYPANAAGFYDPSIADLWIIPRDADNLAPLTGAVLTRSAPGDEDWSRGPVQVALSAIDEHDPEPLIQVGTDSGWAAYDGPFQVATEGETDVHYRAKDAVGNVSEAETATVRIDRTAPVTTVTLGDRSGTSRTVNVTANDVHSGVATTYVRVDAGAWQEVGIDDVPVTGGGLHTVQVYSVDVAGNIEPLQAVPVEIIVPGDPGNGSDGPGLKAAPHATSRPTIAGSSPFRVGATVQARPGTWSVAGLVFGYQWKRNGVAIAGATANRYIVTAADVGARMSVHVTALKEGYRNGMSESAASSAVRAATSQTKVSVKKKKIRVGKRAKVTVQVLTSGPRAKGAVKVTFIDTRTKRAVGKGKKWNRTVRLSAKGKVRVTSPKFRKKGKVRVRVKYQGSREVAASTGSVKMRVVRR